MQEELNQIDSEHPANKSDKRFPRNDLTVKDEFKNIDANDSS